jgi:CheY-like chemotaxis protein
MGATAEILVVEDNPADQHLTFEALREAQWAKRPHLVTNGNDAVRFLHRQGQFKNAPRPDLIILDLNLPGPSGQEILSMIKADPQLNRIPVVIFSTSGNTPEVARSYDLGAACYLRKSEDPEVYFRSLRNLEGLWQATQRSAVKPRSRRSLRDTYKKLREGVRFSSHPNLWWGAMIFFILFLLLLLLRPA